jgi:hypothetical protein
VNRVLAALAGIVGLAALLSRRRRRTAASLRPSPADELRAKLDEAEARTEVAAQEHDERGQPEAPVGGVTTRREDVHEQAREAIEKLR